MGVYDDLDRDIRQQQVDDQRNTRQTTTTSPAARARATNAADIRREYPWLTPGAAASLSRAGHNAQSGATKEAARRAADRRKKKGFGWHSIGDVVGAVGDFVTPEKVEDVIGRQVRGVGPASKAAVRGTFTALDFGQEAIASTFRNIAGNVIPESIPTGARQSRSTGIERAEGDGNFNPIKGTKLGIIAEKVLSGDADEIDLGSGFFPGGDVAKEQKIRARDELAIRMPNGSRIAVTPGRLLAYTITEPGTTEFNWTSGLVDAAFVIGTDPSLHGLKTVGQLRQARKLIDPSIAGGIANATRRTAVTDLATAYLDSKDGRKVVEWAAGEASPYKIYKAFGRKISAEEAADLSKLNDPAAVVEYIRPKLGTSIRAKPYLANPVTRGIKPVDGFSSYVPESISKRLDGVRLFHTMPGRHVDPHNSTDVAENMSRMAINAKLGPAKAEQYFNEAAEARGPIGRFTAVNHILSDIAGELTGPNANRKVSDGLTRMYDDYREYARKYYTDDIGNNAPVLGADIRGVDYVLPTPHLYSEYINRAIPLPDHRALRRATSKYGRLLNHMSVSEDAKRPIPVAALDFVFQDVWKPMQLIRGAWTVRVVGEEQVRMAMMGQKSILNHPLQAILWATHRRGQVDVKGDEFKLMDDVSDYKGALTRRGDNWRDRRMMMGQVNVQRGGKGYGEAGADELANYHADPITRRIIAGLGDNDGVAVRTGNALTDTQEWFWSGAGQKFRKEMAEADGRELLASSRDEADKLIASMHKRVTDKTAFRPELLEAVGDGTFNGAPAFTRTANGLKPSKELQDHIDDLARQGIGPSTYVKELSQRMRGGVASDIGLDKAVDSLFNVFMSKPTNFLSRSPAFRQFYWQRIDELMPSLDGQAQAAVLAKARQAKLPTKTLKRMEARAGRGVGDLDINDADVYAKAFGLDETKRLLYDLTERSQFFDITRHIFPFGEAWGEVLKVWARIGTEKPQTIRKAQMAIEGARGSGFFYPDENGEEWFSYPGSGFITEKFAGVPAPMRGGVASLNLLSNNPLMPGVGPMVQLPASYFLPRKSSWDSVRKMLLPFGEETLEGGAIESFLPPWFQKLRQAGVTPFGRQDQRLWNNTYMESHRYLRSQHGDWSEEKLDAESTQAANRLYQLRSMAQFFAPSAPSPEFMAKDKDGRMMTAFKLTEEYRKLVDADKKNNTDTAVDVFLNTYGVDALEYMQGKTEGGGPVSSKAFKFFRDNEGFVKKYPDTFTLFAPQNEGFDYDAYTELIRLGTIRPLKPKEFVEMANSRVAAMIYRQAQAAVEGADQDESRTWLADIRTQLEKQYPGYNSKPFDDKKVGRQIRELESAAGDPAVRNLPVAKGMRQYLALRKSALQEVRDRGDAMTLKAKSSSDLADWLREHAADLAKKYSGFDEVFNRVFSRELAAVEAED